MAQPKKTGDVRVTTDFREPNKSMIRKPHPMPKILDALQKMEKFKCAAAIDPRKGHCHIPLDKATQKLGCIGFIIEWLVKPPMNIFNMMLPADRLVDPGPFPRIGRRSRRHTLAPPTKRHLSSPTLLGSLQNSLVRAVPGRGQTVEPRAQRVHSGRRDL